MAEQASLRLEEQSSVSTVGSARRWSTRRRGRTNARTCTALGATLWHLLVGHSPFEVPGGTRSCVDAPHRGWRGSALRPRRRACIGGLACLVDKQSPALWQGVGARCRQRRCSRSTRIALGWRVTGESHSAQREVENRPQRSPPAPQAVIVQPSSQEARQETRRGRRAMGKLRSRHLRHEVNEATDPGTAFCGRNGSARPAGVTFQRSRHPGGGGGDTPHRSRNLAIAFVALRSVRVGAAAISREVQRIHRDNAAYYGLSPSEPRSNSDSRNACCSLHAERLWVSHLSLEVRSPAALRLLHVAANGRRSEFARGTLLHAFWSKLRSDTRCAFQCRFIGATGVTLQLLDSEVRTLSR